MTSFFFLFLFLEIFFSTTLYFSCALLYFGVFVTSPSGTVTISSMATLLASQLREAAKTGDLERCELLLSQRVNVDETDDQVRNITRIVRSKSLSITCHFDATRSTYL